MQRENKAQQNVLLHLGLPLKKLCIYFFHLFSMYEKKLQGEKTSVKSKS